MHQAPQQAREPIINAPLIVLVLLAALIIVHLSLRLLPAEDAYWSMIYMAFVPGRLGEIGGAPPGGFWVGVSSMLTHALVHADWLHLGINGAWLLAFGTIIARRSGSLRFLGLFVAASMAGALAFYIVHPTQNVPLVGASGAVSGLMGAAFRLLFSAADQGGMWLLREHPQLVPRMPLIVALQDRRVIAAVLAWVGINLLFAFGFSDMLGEGEIAWEAHLGGFFCGFLLFRWFDRA